MGGEGTTFMKNNLTARGATPRRSRWTRIALASVLFGALGLASAAVAVAATRGPSSETVAAAWLAGDEGLAVESQQAFRDRRRAAFARGAGSGRFQGGGERRGPAMGRDGGEAMMRLGWLMRELELTDEQRDAIREAARDAADARRDGRRAVQDARREFREAAADPERAADEVRALGEAAGRAEADAALSRRGEWDRIAAVLTEEQRARAEELRDQARDRDDRGFRGRRGFRAR